MNLVGHRFTCKVIKKHINQKPEADSILILFRNIKTGSIFEVFKIFNSDF